MGLFEKISNIIHGENYGNVVQMQKILTWIEQQGGVQGVVDKFRSNGLGGIVESWISQGNNLSLSTEQVTSVFESAALQQLASQLGIDSQMVSSIISEYLPKIIDGLSPDGEIPADQDLMTVGMSLLKGKLLG